MIRATALTLAAGTLAMACQPAKTQEQIAAEQAAAAMQQMAATFGGLATATGEAQLDPNQLAAALAGAGAMASATDPHMTAEDRAKLQAITGALASGQVHPAASAWIGGANRALAVLKTVKDVPSANAAKAQLAPIYAEMAAPAAVLGAMSESEQEVAMGSALPQFMSFGMSAASLMIPLANDPALAGLVEDMLEEMPSPD